MDFDLEIVSEGDSNPLFVSIMNAMELLKEATADKIYKRIQKEGNMRYSKPQVDKALNKALKCGIFEVRNNRYRVRDDIVDDEDTVYWEAQKKRDQTPYRMEEASRGAYLNPETDNQRFRKMGDAERSECPNCGRYKKESCGNERGRRRDDEQFVEEELNNLSGPSMYAKRNTKAQMKTAKCKTLPKKTKISKPAPRKRKSLSDSESSEPTQKLPKRNTMRRFPAKSACERRGRKTEDEHRFPQDRKARNSNRRKPRRHYDDDSGESDLASPAPSSRSENDSASTRSRSHDQRTYCKHRRQTSNHDCEMDDEEVPNTSSNVQVSKSSRSIKSLSGSYISDRSSTSDCRRKKDDGQGEKFHQEQPSTSRNAGTKDQAANMKTSNCQEHINSNSCSSNNNSNSNSNRGQLGKDQSSAPVRNLCGKQCGGLTQSDEPKPVDRKSDWMGAANNPQESNIKQSNDVLTIEPRDSMPFQGPVDASYIS